MEDEKLARVIFYNRKDDLEQLKKSLTKSEEFLSPNRHDDFFNFKMKNDSRKEAKFVDVVEEAEGFSEKFKNGQKIQLKDWDFRDSIPQILFVFDFNKIQQTSFEECELRDAHKNQEKNCGKFLTLSTEPSLGTGGVAATEGGPAAQQKPTIFVDLKGLAPARTLPIDEVATGKMKTKNSNVLVLNFRQQKVFDELFLSLPLKFQKSLTDDEKLRKFCEENFEKIKNGTADFVNFIQKYQNEIAVSASGGVAGGGALAGAVAAPFGNFEIKKEKKISWRSRKPQFF